MPWNQTGAAVVIVARQFNPSVFSQLWLVDNKVMGHDDFLSDCVFTEMFVLVQSRRFRLLVMPQQLQFVPIAPVDEQEAIVVDKVGAIVRILPHTPFNAIGLNFDWQLTPGDRDFTGLARSLFFHPGDRLCRHFDTPDARFGGYFSRNVSDFRLRLDIKPVIVALDAERTEERLNFGFNFHADIGENAAQRIEQKLHRWNEVRTEASAIIDSIEPRGQQ